MNDILRNLERDMKQYLPRMDKPNPPLTDTPQARLPQRASVGGANTALGGIDRLTVVEVRDRLDYDPNSGVFTWVRPGSRRAIGEAAGGPHPKGYWFIGLHGRRYAAHRLAWAWVHGVWPSGVIDHIDGNGMNNRITNLRDVPISHNMHNRRLRSKNNVSGFLGVYQVREKFVAQIGSGGQNFRSRAFSTPAEAHAAYLEMKRLHHRGAILPTNVSPASPVGELPSGRSQHRPLGFYSRNDQ
jgi:hypothetical protein